MPLIVRGSLVLAGFFLLYFHGLSDTGLLGPDEPRYASVAREMAQSGDWITPRLWGEPWFEKPALLYWLMGICFRLGMPQDLAPRLPVAILGSSFLILYYWLLRRRFSETAALLSTVILGTSAGWLVYSHTAVTDVPLTVFFAATMLLVLDWLEAEERWKLAAAGVCLGLAVLAKGLVPLVLAFPIAWFARRRLLQLWPMAAGTLAVALPWYMLCTMANGSAFLMEFIVRHHFGRYTTPELQHVQQFWYYVPVMLGLLFPWTPLLIHLRRPNSNLDRQFLWAWLLFGFVFFSAGPNKLAGYLLPLLPALSALIGDAVAESKSTIWTIAASALLLAFIPALLPVLPDAVASGLGSALPNVRWMSAAVPAVALLLAAIGIHWKWGTREACAFVAIMVTICVWRIERDVFPALDDTVSARGTWRRIAATRDQVCLDDPHRRFRYGMNYYSVTPLAECDKDPKPLRIR